MQTTIVRGIRALRNDSRFIDQLFRNLDQKSLAEIRQFIKEQPIDLSLNYPRTVLKVPAIVILLKSERESEAYLSDSMGIETPEDFSFDNETMTGVLGGAASASSISGNTILVFGPFNALTGTENTLRIASSEWVTDQFAGNDLTLRILAGTGKGQIRKIVSNSPTVVTIEGQWVAIPDNTSLFEIVAPPDELLGEPSSLYDRTARTTYLERRGALYDVSYQIQVIGPNPEFTIYLATIIKAIFTLARRFMEKQGIINFKLSASDFVPRAEYQPDLTYMRALTIEFRYPFDIFETFGDVVSIIDLKLEYDDWPTAEGVVVSDTSFTINKDGDVVSNLSDVQRVYFGVATPPGVYDANFIQNVIGTQGTAISSKRQRTINFTTGPGEKMYYIYPASYGGIPGNFIDAGTQIPTGMSIKATTSITTSFGTEPYNVWESDFPNLNFVAMKIT